MLSLPIGRYVGKEEKGEEKLKPADKPKFGEKKP